MSAAASRQSAANQLQAYQLALLDVLLFSEFINARADSKEQLADFYAGRFRAEAKTAFDAWIAMRPFENTNAPPHPFVTNLYKPRLIAESKVSEEKSQQLWQQAGEAGRTGRSYVLVTVLLASALFCGGTAAKFDTPWIHRSVVILGVGAFAFAAIRLLMLPVKF